MNKLVLVRSIADIVAKLECAKYYMTHIQRIKIAKDSALQDFDLEKIRQLNKLISDLSQLSNNLLDECIGN